MNMRMDGKKISVVMWPDESQLRSDAECELSLSVTYHGDHDESWIIKTVVGREVARYNPRFVEAIVWAEAPE